MNFQTFYDQTDEHGVSNQDKLAQRQHIIRRVDTTTKDKHFEAAEGRHDGVVIVDGTTTPSAPFIDCCRPLISSINS